MAVLVEAEALKVLATTSVRDFRPVQKYHSFVEVSTQELDSLEAPGKTELKQLEGVIQQSITSWVDLYEALEKIRDKRLFVLTEYKSFKAYAELKWRISDSVVFRGIKAAKVYRELDGMVHGYTHCYELSMLPDKQARLDVWEDFNSYEKRTTTLLKNIIQLKLGKTPKPRTTRAVQVPVEVANELESMAKEMHKSRGDVVALLVQKLKDL